MAPLTITNHSRDSAGFRYVYAVVSRRARGISVGINLNTNNACNWRCIYCQVPGLIRGEPTPVELDTLERELRTFLADAAEGDYLERHAPEGMRKLVDIAVSGNGEPTSAREFPQVIECLGRIRSELALAPDLKIRVITNGSLVGREAVRQGLARLGALDGEVWFKVDAGTSDGFRRINDVNLSPARVARNLARCAELCATWVQTCMFRTDGRPPDPSEIEAYVSLLCGAGVDRLRGVLLYGLARAPMQPEASRLSNMSVSEFDAVVRRIKQIGLSVTVSP